MVAHDAARPEVMHNVFPNWIRTVPKLHNGRGCMHMKVSFFKFHDRIVVHMCSGPFYIMMLLVVHVGKISPFHVARNLHSLIFDAQALLQNWSSSCCCLHREYHRHRLARYRKCEAKKFKLVYLLGAHLNLVSFACTHRPSGYKISRCALLRFRMILKLLKTFQL